MIRITDLEKWQADSSNIDTTKVQFWKNGIMITRIKQSEAIRRVDNGIAFVISSQAIGHIEDSRQSDWQAANPDFDNGVVR